jgi:Predicted integral membrane protein (DUF2269)
MLIFKALHILSMVTMVMLFSGGELYYAFAIRARNVRAVAWLQSTERRNGIAFFALGALLSGIAFGLLTAATGGLDFFDGWLIAAYVLIGLFVVNSALFATRVVRIGDHAVEAEEGTRPVEEVVAEMAATRSGVLLFAINATIFALIILDMVLKPF